MTVLAPETAPVRAVRRRGEYVGVAALTLVAMAVRIWLAVQDGGPTLYFDEAYYIENARAIAEGQPYATAHYPPLYSLLLVPAQLVADWYPATMAISAATSALTVPAAWLLGRAIGLRQPLWAAACAAALPSALPYAGFLMSENLSTPLFVAALALAIRARAREGWLLGAAIAGLVLTKYLFLPAGIILALVYVLLRRRRGENWSAAEWGRTLARVAIPIALAAVVWLAYAFASGFTLFEAAGLSVPSRTIGRGASEGDPARLILWAVVYGTILLLPALPTGFLVLAYLTRRRAAGVRLTRDQAGFAVGLLALVLTYLAVTMQHSYGAEYNYPDPTRAWGRYLMHLAPCLLVLGLLLIQVIAAGRRVLHPLVALACLGATIGVAVIGWRVLYDGWIFGMQGWSFSYTITAADVFPFRTDGTRILFVVATIVIAALMVARPPRALARPLASAVLTAALVVTSVNYLAHSVPYDPYSTNYTNFNGSLGRKMFDVLAADGSAGATAFFVLADGLRNDQLTWDARFWDEPADTVSAGTVDDLGLPTDLGARTDDAADEVFAAAGAVDACRAAEECYLVTTSPLGSGPARVDDRWGQSVFFYPVSPGVSG